MAPRIFLTPSRKRKKASSRNDFLDIIRAASTLQDIKLGRSREERAQKQFDRQGLNLRRQEERETLAEDRARDLQPEKLMQERLATQEAERLARQRGAEGLAASAFSSLGQPIQTKFQDIPAQNVTAQDILTSFEQTPEIAEFSGSSPSIAGLIERLTAKAKPSLFAGLKPIDQQPLDEGQKNVLSALSSKAMTGKPFSSKDTVKLLREGGFIPRGTAESPAAIQTLEFKMDTVNKLVENGALPEDFDVGKAMLQIVGGAEPKDFLGEFLAKNEILQQQRLDAASSNRQFAIDREVASKNLTNLQRHNKGREMAASLISEATRLHNLGVDISKRKDIVQRLNFIETRVDPQGTIGPATKKALAKFTSKGIMEKIKRKIDEATGGLTGLTTVENSEDYGLPAFKPTPTQSISTGTSQPTKPSKGFSEADVKELSRITNKPEAEARAFLERTRGAK